MMGIKPEGRKGLNIVIMKIQHIQKGNHYCNFFDRRFKLARKISIIDTTVNKSWWYPKENEDSKDVNKLPGFSIGDHRINGVRPGFVPYFKSGGINKKGIKIYMYTTVNRVDSKDSIYVGVAYHGDVIRTTKSGNDYKMSILHNKFTWTDPEKAKTYTHPNEHIFSYYTNFYFGGDNTAPHDMIAKSKIY